MSYHVRLPVRLCLLHNTCAAVCCVYVLCVGVGGHITVYSAQCIHSSVSVACARIYYSI